MTTPTKPKLTDAQIEALRLAALPGAFIEWYPGSACLVLRQVEPSTAHSYGRREQIGRIRTPTLDRLSDLGFIRVLNGGSALARRFITDVGRAALADRER